MAFSPRLICQRLLSTLARTRKSTASISPWKVIHRNNYSSFSSSPWLMLPPAYNDNTKSIGYNFYSLAENRVLTRPETNGLSDFMPKPIDDLGFRGSSKGWIYLFNPYSLDLFLYNPISLRYIQLPPIHDMFNFSKGKVRHVSKVVLSSSPDEGDCRAVMMYNGIHVVAFCCPGRSKEWTPFGKTHTSCYADIAYSSRQNLFFALNKDLELETWDLSDLLYPRSIKMINLADPNYMAEDRKQLLPKDFCRPDHYLVVADELFADGEDDVLMVTRYVMEQVAPDGSYTDTLSPNLYPHMTIGFDVDVYDQEEGDLKGPVESLGDLSLFLGHQNDSVALSAARFPELKPNSIYFTDSGETIVEDTNELFGGHDIGIFNYGNKTVSPCYYPCDLKNLKRIAPSPMWFFPTV